MPNPTYVSCLHCGKDFVPRRDQSIFCSEVCEDEAVKEGVEEAKRKLRRVGWREQ